MRTFAILTLFILGIIGVVSTDPNSMLFQFSSAIMMIGLVAIIGDALKRTVTTPYSDSLDHRSEK